MRKKSKSEAAKPSTIPLPPDWREAFKSFTLRPNFVLSLSRAMLEMLCAVAEDVHWDRSAYGMRTIHRPDNWYASEDSLIKRGLIVRREQSEIDAAGRKFAKTWANVDSYSCCKLTPAGEHVVALLKVCGLFIDADAAIEKKRKA